MNETHVVGAMALVLCLLLAPLAAAQTDTARIVGTVTDTSGGIIPGVTVIVTNEKTGAQRIRHESPKSVRPETQLLAFLWSFLKAA